MGSYSITDFSDQNKHQSDNPHAAPHSEDEYPAGVTLLSYEEGRYHLALQVVPVEQVVPHEHYHGRRVAELSARLMAEGKLINPPITAFYKGKYVVLDGATRLTALRYLGYPHLIVQVVAIEPQQVELSTWHHAVHGGDVAGLLKVLRGIEGLQVNPYTRERFLDEGLPPGALGYLFTVGQEGFVLEAGANSADGDDPWLRVLNHVVAAYGEWGDVERTLVTDMELLASQLDRLAALVSFPRFTIQTILELAAHGRTVPAGITRFIIPGRILRLNAPLTKLAEDEPLALKRQWLNEFIHAKLLARQVRSYEEPVVLLDE